MIDSAPRHVPRGPAEPLARGPAAPGANKLARASWIAPLLSAGLSAFPEGLYGGVVVKEGLMYLVAVAGFVAGVVALTGIRRYGRKRILVPSLIGLVINGLLIAVWTSNFVEAYARPRAARTGP
jgi:hypothetical protein